MLSQATVDDELLKNFWEAECQSRLRYLKVAHVPLSIAVLLAAAVLDVFIYPELAFTFFWLRMAAAGALGGFLLLLFTDFARQQVVALGLFWGVFTNFSLSVLIFLADGANSPYYAGINLVLLGVVVLLASTVRETLFVICASILIYIVACLLHVRLHPSVIVWSTFFNNLFFLSMTGVICVISSHLISTARYQDFYLRHELDVRNRKLQEMDRLKSQFFANISHELRTPLTLILAPVENLLTRKQQLGSDIREALQLTHDSAQRLLRLINDLLEVVRLEGRGLVLQQEPVDLSSYVPGMVESVRHLAQAKQLHLRVEGSQRPLIVSADPSRLERVFLNLLTNAVKFTPAGGCVTTRWSSDDQGRARIEVEDTGIGIPAEQLPHIFERFHQVDGSSTRNQPGLGLGLALAQELVQEHGGSLQVHSTVGVGTTFVVKLPQVAEPAAPHTSVTVPSFGDVSRPTPPIKASHGESQSVHYAPAPHDAAQVLVVEDEPDMLCFISSILSPDFRLLQATDGSAGLAMARRHVPDALLLDMMLPGITGLDVCRALKQDEATRDIKVIILTARADDETKLEALKCGADDYLTKPFSTVEVKTRLQNLLASASLQRQLRQRNVDLEDALTDLKNTEAKLIQSEKMVAVGTLSAGLLHEINNPLNFTLTAIQYLLARRDEMDKDLVESLTDIDEGMQRIKNIVTSLWTFAHPEAGQAIHEFALTHALDTALRFTSHLRNGVRIARALSDQDRVRGSENHITHVLVNLLVNAHHALESANAERKPTIQIRTQAHDHRLFVSVQDNGSGISPDALPRIFDPFFTTRDVGGGLGLGLSICHTIVQNHGGDIKVTSDGQHGSTFTFDLPLA